LGLEVRHFEPGHFPVERALPQELEPGVVTEGLPLLAPQEALAR
jgi:hypothetical protein